MAKSKTQIGRANRRKGARGVLQAAEVLGRLLPGVEIEVVHATGRKDLHGGDILVGGDPVQVRCGVGGIPKALYGFFPEGCTSAMVRRVGPRDRGLAWLLIRLLPSKEEEAPQE